jgi:hypothetical protein
LRRLQAPAGAGITDSGTSLFYGRLAIVVQMPASHPMLPDDRKHREVATRQASRQRGGSDDWTLVEFRPARWLATALTVLALWLVHQDPRALRSERRQPDPPEVIRANGGMRMPVVRTARGGDARGGRARQHPTPAPTALGTVSG